MIKCSNCGATLVFDNDKYPKFQCKNYKEGKCTVSHAIVATKVEKAILYELNDILQSADSMEFQYNIRRSEDTEEDELATLEKQYNNIDVRLERASDAYLAEIYTIEEYKRKREELEQEKERLAFEIENLQSNISTAEPEPVHTGFKERVQGVLDLITSDCDISVKGEAIRSIVDKIVYDKANKAIEVYYYDM